MSAANASRVLVVGLALLLAAFAAAAQAAPSAIEAQSRALEKASAAVVGVEVLAVDGARSAATLGRARRGSGVVIDGQGLVLTIGYLILEAEQVQVVTDDARQLPARVVAYDVATGFGLVRALAPIGLEPVPLGRSAAVRGEEDLMIASGGDGGALSMARLVSRRSFSGYWEYHIEGALFTAPARPDHSGAGLFNERGELVGIGSLIVRDAAGGGRHSPGNMFVPVDLLAPILPDLVALGRSRQSVRAWIGLNCVDVDGRIRVVRINEDSPADVAGFEVGDQVTGLDGRAVKDVEQLWKALWAGQGAERTVTIDIERDGKPQRLTVQTVDRQKTLRKAEGV